MTKKVVFFPFKEEKMCFNHIILNALDMHDRGVEVKVVIEGKTTKLVKELIEEGHPNFKKLMDLGLIEGVCKACSMQTGVHDWIAEKTELKLLGSMSGHPPMTDYVLDGYQVITL